MRDRAMATKATPCEPAWALLDVVERVASESRDEPPRRTSTNCASSGGCASTASAAASSFDCTVSASVAGLDDGGDERSHPHWRLPREAARTADASVNCCVTSPPYFGLRDYGCEGQMGLEPTPDEFVAGMVEVFREVRSVLRDDGTLWLNIGDSYCERWQVGRSHWRETRQGLHCSPASAGNRDTPA
jgi:hypothetical protein